jgi:hypothetical protein
VSEVSKSCRTAVRATRGGGGLAPAINNKPLPRFLITLRVRQGIGAIPPFWNAEIAPDKLNDLDAFLKALRRQG